MHVWRELGGRGGDRARGVAKEASPDLVFTQFAVAALGAAWPAAFAAVAQARAGGATSVVGYHEATRDVALLPVVGSRIYRAVARHADHNVAFSSAAASTLASLGVEPVQQVVLGIPASHRTGIVADLPRVDFLALGFIHPDKGLDVLLRAMAELPVGERRTLLIAGSPRRRQGAFRVMEVGDRMYDRRIHRLARRLPAGSIRFRDYVPEAELDGVLRSARVLVLPYRRSTQSGVASLALAHGVPVVASALAGLRDALGPAALYCKPNDPNALARVLRAACEPAMNRRLATEASRRARVLSSDYVAGQIVLGAGR